MEHYQLILNIIVYFIHFGTVLLLTIYYVQNNEIRIITNQIFTNWNKEIPVDITITNTDNYCNSTLNYKNIISKSLPGFKFLSYCNVTDTYKFEDNYNYGIYDVYNIDVNYVKNNNNCKIQNRITHIKTNSIDGKTFCIKTLKNSNYFKLYQNVYKICPDGYIEYGVIDTLNNKLCLKKNVTIRNSTIENNDIDYYYLKKANNINNKLKEASLLLQIDNTNNNNDNISINNKTNNLLINNSFNENNLNIYNLEFLITQGKYTCLNRFNQFLFDDSMKKYLLPTNIDAKIDYIYESCNKIIHSNLFLDSRSQLIISFPFKALFEDSNIKPSNLNNNKLKNQNILKEYYKIFPYYFETTASLISMSYNGIKKECSFLINNNINDNNLNHYKLIDYNNNINLLNSYGALNIACNLSNFMFFLFLVLLIKELFIHLHILRLLFGIIHLIGSLICYILIIISYSVIKVILNFTSFISRQNNCFDYHINFLFSDIVIRANFSINIISVCLFINSLSIVVSIYSLALVIFSKYKRQIISCLSNFISQLYNI